MLDINFEREKPSSDPSWKANFKVSSGDEVTMYIFHFNNDGEGWGVYVDIRSPSSEQYQEYVTKLRSSCEHSTIADGFEYNNVKVTSSELATVVKATKEIVEKTRPRHCAQDSYFGV